jgi:hypothetical protein
VSGEGALVSVFWKRTPRSGGELAPTGQRSVTVQLEGFAAVEGTFEIEVVVHCGVVKERREFLSRRRDETDLPASSPSCLIGPGGVLQTNTWRHKSTDLTEA